MITSFGQSRYPSASLTFGNPVKPAPETSEPQQKGAPSAEEKKKTRYRSPSGRSTPNCKGVWTPKGLDEVHIGGTF